jgi:hypothetical protein
MGAPEYQQWSIEQARAHLRVRRWVRREAAGWCMAAFALGVGFGVVCMAVGS